MAMKSSSGMKREESTVITQGTSEGNLVKLVGFNNLFSSCTHSNFYTGAFATRQTSLLKSFLGFMNDRVILSLSFCPYAILLSLCVIFLFCLINSCRKNI